MKFPLLKLQLLKTQGSSEVGESRKRKWKGGRQSAEHMDTEQSEVDFKSFLIINSIAIMMIRLVIFKSQTSQGS